MEPIKYYKDKISDTDVVVGHKDQRFSSAITSSEVLNSTIELIGMGGRALLVQHSVFDGCEIIGRKAFGYFLGSASWKNCVFKGKFTDCVFGHDPRDGKKVEIYDNDFSSAELHIVVYRGGLNYESCRFASWPTIVFAMHQLDLASLRKRGLSPRMLSMISCGKVGDEQWLVLNAAKYDENDFDIYCMLHQQPGIYFHGSPFESEPSSSDIAAASAKYLAQLEKDDLYRFWNWITQSVSLIAAAIDSSSLILTLKSGTAPHVPLPEKFKVCLHDVSRVELAGADFLMEAKNKKSFRLMGASIADDFGSVSLKGHRKSMGTIDLSYESMTIERCDGKDDPIESLANWTQ